jgi:hypothetical protein
VTTALATNGLGKRYGRLWALRDCSLRPPPDRVFRLGYVAAIVIGRLDSRGRSPPACGFEQFDEVAGGSATRT